MHKSNYHKGYRWWYNIDLVEEKPIYNPLCNKIRTLLDPIEKRTLIRNERHKETDRPLHAAPNITQEHILDLLDAQKGRCAYLNVPLRIESGDWMMSLERLDNNVGYVQGNVVIVCVETNTGSFHWSREFADHVWS